LAVQSANGTNSETDRQSIQDEIDQLVTEIDRVAETTKFNETYLLKGDETKGTSTVYTANYKIGTVTFSKTNVTASHKWEYDDTATLIIASKSIENGSSVAAISISKGDDLSDYIEDNTPDSTKLQDDVTIDSAKYWAFTAGAGTLSNLTNGTSGEVTSADIQYFWDKTANQVVRVAVGEDLSNYITNVSGSDADIADGYMLLDDGQTVTTVKGKGTKEELQLYDAQGNDVSSVALGAYFNDFGTYIGGLYRTNQATTDAADIIDATGNINDGMDIIKNYVNINSTNVTNALTFSLHVGADSDSSNKIKTTIESMSAASLGVDILKSTSAGMVDTTGNKATDAIDVISAAIQKVSTQRSALGAVQNRLEHTIKNLDNVVENTTSAESQIRDTDMATEMVAYSNANILAQAGQSMLAQANQSNQGVLSLLG
jgi:flagellin